MWSANTYLILLERWQSISELTAECLRRLATVLCQFSKRLQTLQLLRSCHCAGLQVLCLNSARRFQAVHCPSIATSAAILSRRLPALEIPLRITHKTLQPCRLSAGSR